ncbi:MAG: diguanylate cyclase [Rhodospirillales bacterium]
MERRANILCVGERSAEMERLAITIAGERDGVFFVTSERAGLGVVAENRPDMVIVAEYLRQGNRDSFTRLLNNGDGVAPTPVAWLCNPADADAYINATNAGADEVFFGDEEDVMLLARTRPLIRMSMLYEEMWRRLSIARRFGLEPETVVTSSAPEADEPKLLLLETGDAGGFGGDLAEDGLTCRVDDLVAAEQELVSGAYDALLFDATDETPDWLDFCARIRNNPRLFHLPVVAATNGEKQFDLALYGAGVTQVVFKYGDMEVWRFLSAKRARNFALGQRLNRSLRQTMHDETVDPLTWTYSPAFLSDHLMAAVGTARAMRHPVSIIRVKIANYPEMAAEFSLPSLYHMIQQVAQWITRLLRTEDLVARDLDDSFTIVLPNTPQHEAEIVKDRVLGVLVNTDLAVYDVYRPVAVDLIAGIAHMELSDSAEAMMERAAPK